MMRLLNGIPLALLFLTACISPDGQNDGDGAQDLPGLHSQFKAEKDSSFTVFSRALNVLKLKSRADLHKDAFAADAGKVALDFDSKAMLFMANMWEDSTTLGAGNMHFGTQRTLNDCKELLANPIDSFKTQYNDAGRLKNFKRISSFGSDLMAALEFVVVLQTLSTETPTWYGDDFNPGEYKGKLLLYEFSNQKLLAVVDVQAGSSKTVSAQNFADLGKAAAADYLEHINTSIKEALSSNFEITGKPSQLQ